MKKESQEKLASTDGIENVIYFIRGKRVILDTDLANLYGVKTKRLNEQVKRNLERFPLEFMFQLTEEEKLEVVAICDHLQKLKFFKTKPYAFTEHGALMVANVLKNKQAISMSIEIIKAFIRLRQLMKYQTEMMKEMGMIKEFMLKNSQHTNQELRKVWAAIEKLTKRPEEEIKIGFRLE